MFRGFLFAVLWSVILAPVAYASTILTFNSVEAGDSTSWTLSCSDCSMLAFNDNDSSAYGSGTIFDLAGTLGASGSAFTPVTGKPSERNPDLAGDHKEELFLEAVAEALGDSPIGGSFQKTGSTGNPNAGAGAPTDAGDYFLWKASDYAGIAKILFIGQSNIFTFSGSHGLSHTAHISTQIVPHPLPAGLPLLLTGLCAFAFMRRRRHG